MARPASLETATEIASQKHIALLGASRGGKKFANALGVELKDRGCVVRYVHPEADTIAGEPCFRNLKDVPQPVDTALIVVRPERALEAVRDAAATGIRRVWLQRGAESEAALQFCEDNGIAAVGGYCMLMFAQPSYMPHTLHRGLQKVFGRFPK